MIVYLIQKLHWQYDDNFYELDNDSPVKVFVSRDDAEAERQRLDAAEREAWREYERLHPDRPALTPDLEPVAEQEFFQIVDLELSE